MGFLRSMLAPREERDYAPDDDFWYSNPSRSAAGIVRVTPETALTLSAVYCAVRIIAESVAQLPLILYRRLENGGKERATDHPLYSLLHQQPNDEQTSFEWREMMVGFTALRGNGISQIERTGGGEVAALVPLRPDRIRLERRDNKLTYWYRSPVTNVERPLRRDQIHHLRGMSSDGVTGLSPVTLARETLELMLAQQNFGANVFGNQAKPSGVLEHPAKLNDVAMKRLKESWHESYEGSGNAGKTVILEEGMKWHQVGMSSEDAQFLQSRKFEVTEIARWFNLPPHMLKDLERSTFSNIEQQSLEFVTYSLMPWLIRWEQAIERDLLDADERAELFVEFLVDGLLRGDAKSRAETLAIKRQNGVVNADEWRELDNMNPQPNDQGKAYLIPLNMIPADQVGEVPASKDGVGSTSGSGMAKNATEPDEVRATRETRSITARLRIRQSYRRLFHAAAERYVRKEVTAIRKAVKQNLGQRNAAQFVRWLAEFYADFGPDIIRAMTPVVGSFADSVAAEASSEVGSPIMAPAELERFVARYVETMALRHIESSKGQLLTVMNDSEANKAVDNIEERLAEWLKTRPDKIADRETVQADNATAQKSYQGAGVRRVKWQKIGETCPMCTNLDGRVIAADGIFVAAGDTLHADGQDPMLIRTTKSHPPLHRACDCILVAA